MQISIRIKRPTLESVGTYLAMASFIYLFAGSPVFAYSGPNPQEGYARAMEKLMWHLMICLPGLALGIMWTIRGRKLKKPRKPDWIFRFAFSLKKDDISSAR